MKKIIKEFMPPIILKLLKKISGREYGFYGDFQTWEDASRFSAGYDSDAILDKVKDSLLKVRDGKAACERDSVLFDRIEYSWPLLAGLMMAALENNNKLSVLDFGGSLGSTFFQNRKFLNCVSKVNWNIVEQKKIVEYGKKYFANESLDFFFNIDECFRQVPDINVIVLSSVIQYIEKPYELLNNLVERNVKCVIVDRTPLLKTSKDRIVIQKIPSEIFGGCLPAWLLNEDNFVGAFSERYDLLEEFEAFDKMNIDCEFKGFIFKLK
ncbi:MAG: hypothetical protein ACD_59C00032G0007 [uncultured bacterium]|nr:MAG: hypothetical protein ACD_59C00032G0007 [uncultured bacterium]